MTIKTILLYVFAAIGAIGAFIIVSNAVAKRQGKPLNPAATKLLTTVGL